MKSWRCLENCGACCHLEPNERPQLAEYLTDAELTHYFSLVGADGWCIHYDQASRRCQIYADRPDFCRVEPEGFERRFAVEPADFDEFAIDCCLQQIGGVYGPASPEMRNYERTVLAES
ncbi:MAG: YkgJ family cysteine cluster protein [Cyanobacteria bacterium P01_H01_bin.15]